MIHRHWRVRRYNHGSINEVIRPCLTLLPLSDADVHCEFFVCSGLRDGVVMENCVKIQLDHILNGFSSLNLH